MSIDFDGLVNAVVTDPAIFGKAIVYAPQGTPPFTLNVVFDEAWQTVEGSGRRGIALPVSTTKPMIGCRAGDFPAGVVARQGDACTIDGQSYEVAAVKPDGVSGWLLITLN